MTPGHAACAIALYAAAASLAAALCGLYCSERAHTHDALELLIAVAMQEAARELAAAKHLQLLQLRAAVCQQAHSLLWHIAAEGDVQGLEAVLAAVWEWVEWGVWGEGERRL